ncbi:MAG: DNA-directed RNA polymerase subunit beta, partial [Armatimonadetes bacterium CG07_land_8_20_14_0_80_40_9]
MEKDKREKFSYAKLSEAAQLPVPNLIEIQQNSFSWFIKEGLLELMREIFPVADFTGNLSLEFLSYSLDKSVFTLDQCRDKDMHYAAPLRMKFRLINKNSGEIKEQEVLLGSFPLMTEMGTFIINGAERVVVSQLTRSPGIYFKETSLSGEERSYSAKIIPRRGSWVEFDLDPKGVIWIRMERARKLAATTFLRALGYSQNLDIFKLFGQKVKLTNPLTSSLLGRLVEEDLIDPISQVVIPCAGKVLDLDLAKRIEVARIKEMSAWEVPDCIRNTLEQDPTTNSSEAYLDVYKKLRPTEPPTKESAKSLINTLFFDLKHYDLGRVGRYKINQKFGKRTGPEDLVSQPLTKEDFLEVIKYLIKLSRGEGELDDIDHLGNRRVRSVGELLQNQFRVGLLRLVKIARERMMIQDKEIMTPQSLINIRPLVAAISGFFGSSQLSQFMDQTNPLAELTHKRRLSALGPGGLSRERAGFEVRDVHRTHYGRICPIETPEGPNIGLINSLASYARVSELGFIETPYRRVKKGKVSDEISYLTADVEDEYYIAQANTPLTKDGKFADEHVMARYKDLNLLIHSDKIEFMDVSPRQVVSVATALIPFLEHDDANRALMGSNMQRQSVPLLCTEVPLISTGIEAKVANDSGTVVKAKDSGLVKEVNSQEIVVENSKGLKEIYPLRKFARSNQGTCVNQKPLIREKQKVEKREIIADGPCTDGGELALGRNILVAFMPWEGYNFEDAILISERLVREDVYTSIHIEEYESEARDTKLGAEEITRDTPNVSEDMLKDLDEKGIIRVGAEVSTEDILVGKVTPKGETELTPEERLLRAIFGEKAREMRDTSLRVPPGGKGKVVEVKVFSREDGEELPPGVNQLVRVYVAQKRKISEGDKVSGRHGNKGVIAKIFPQEDLPYLPDGTPVDKVLN